MAGAVEVRGRRLLSLLVVELLLLALELVLIGRFLEVHQVDMATLPSDSSIFKDTDYVFHFGGLGDIVPSIEHPLEYTHANITGTLAVLEAARHANVKKFVYAASSSCYGPDPVVPTLTAFVAPEKLIVPSGIDAAAWDGALAGTSKYWDDYAPGMRIDHVDGMTIEEAEHQLATRLYQNTARVHFNQHAESQGRFGKRLVYGGHIISLARALSFNGLANAFRIAAINGGQHVNPVFAGDTIFAWSEVLERFDLPGRTDVGAMRLRTVATKNRPCADFPLKGADAKHLPEVVLDFDYTVLMPRRG